MTGRSTTPCDHDWMERGTPGDLWQECFLCGEQRDKPGRTPTESTEARWEIVDAHRCTACGHLDQDGYRMVEHLRTHDVTAPARTPS